MSVQQLSPPPRAVLRISGLTAVGPEVSWCPDGVVGWQPVNAYLVKSPDAAVLVDTGVGAHVEHVLDGLRSQLAPGAHLSVILTRTEMECCLNLPAIESEFTVDQVWYTGGITVPVTRATARRIQVDPGTSVDLEAAPGITVRVYSPLLRLLPVLWVGDLESKVLCTSDAFCHVLSDERGDMLAGATTAHLDAFHEQKFGWVKRASVPADIALIADNVEQILSAADWAALGPTYGAPLLGNADIRANGAALVSHLRGAVDHAA